MSRIYCTVSVSEHVASSRSAACGQWARPNSRGIATQGPVPGPLRSLLFINPRVLGARRQINTCALGGSDDTRSRAKERTRTDSSRWTGSTNVEAPDTTAGTGDATNPQLSLAETQNSSRAPSRNAGRVSLGAPRQQEDVRGVPTVPSRELVELVRVQLDMLVSMLESRISEEFNSVPGNDYNLGVRCAMYCRTASTSAMSAMSPASNPSMSSVSSLVGKVGNTEANTLRLQLVAASGGFGDDGFAFDDDDVFSSSSSSSVITASSEMEETWLANQAMIVLPDNGGLMLPLTHKSFLVGLLLVERVAKEVGFGSNVDSSMGQAGGTNSRSNSSVWIPPVQDVFGPAEMGIIKQSAQALSMSCAMELRAIVEAAQNKIQQERLRGLLSQASKPLTTLKTLGRMLQPRLAPGEPERDMTDGVVAQGQYLGDLIEQIQKTVGGAGGNGGSGKIGSGRTGDTRRDGRPPSSVVASKGGMSNKVDRKNGRGIKSTYKYALPSSSIGSDNTLTWDVVSSDEDEQEESRLGADERAVDDAERDAELVIAKEHVLGGSSLTSSTDVSDILRPLLDSATAFCAIKGVQLVVDGDVMNETAPCFIQGEYSLVKHVLGIILDGAIELAEGQEQDARVRVRVIKEKGKAIRGIVFEVAVSIVDIDEDEAVYLDLGANLELELDALMGDVEGLNGQVQLRDESIALFLPLTPPQH